MFFYYYVKSCITFNLVYVAVSVQFFWNIIKFYLIINKLNNNFYYSQSYISQSTKTIWFFEYSLSFVRVLLQNILYVCFNLYDCVFELILWHAAANGVFRVTTKRSTTTWRETLTGVKTNSITCLVCRPANNS